MTGIVHVVLVEWEFLPQERAASVNSIVDDHLGSIPGIIDVQRGAPAYSAGLEDGLHWALYVRFDSRKSLDAYWPHPDHLAVAEFINAHSRRVIVFDLAASCVTAAELATRRAAEVES
jgi:hypothetical protein